VAHGKQPGMRSVSLRSMVQIDPYKDDLFCKVIEQRKLHKSDDALLLLVEDSREFDLWVLC
jgi:hypothetical protein